MMSLVFTNHTHKFLSLHIHINNDVFSIYKSHTQIPHPSYSYKQWCLLVFTNHTHKFLILHIDACPKLCAVPALAPHHICIHRWSPCFQIAAVPHSPLWLDVPTLVLMGYLKCEQILDMITLQLWLKSVFRKIVHLCTQAFRRTMCMHTHTHTNPSLTHPVMV